ncbi:MAG: TlpA family protein disulfide reductase [Nitrospinota bacterium]|nr:TlpA family protein disulfide reductase [Nitrospinota bacterium]
MEEAIQKKPVHIFIPFAVLVTVLFSFLITAINKVELKPFEVEYPAEAFIAPSFKLPSLSGGTVDLKSYRGKVVFINFWATWCATCKVEMPSMQKVYDQFKDKGLEMLTISVDKDQSLIQPFMEEYKLTFPVLLDPESEVAKKNYKTTGVPETFIVNKHGIIVHKAIGPRDWATDEAIAAFAQLVDQS